MTTAHRRARLVILLLLGAFCTSLIVVQVISGWPNPVATALSMVCMVLSFIATAIIWSWARKDSPRP